MSDRWQKDKPTETTRLLADSVRIARENEQIGKDRFNGHLSLISHRNTLLLYSNVYISDLSAQQTTEEVMEQGETLQDARDKVNLVFPSVYRYCFII